MSQERFSCDEVPTDGGSAAEDAAQTDIFSSAAIPTPSARPLRIFAFDPSAGRLVGNHMTAAVRYEELKPGPVGERIAVIDYDGTNKTFYQPVDLDDRRLLVGGGLAPCESDPRFHQQMVYAVASDTLQRFERALGRRIHWRGTRRCEGAPSVPRGAARCLNLFPHAMCEANAFYSPDAHGILFGYFKANRLNQGRNLPGQTVFTCLSHDIIAHETTHAVIDGIRSFFMEPTNIDVPAFHEAISDVVALFSHFSHREVLLDTLQKTGGRLFDDQLRSEALHHAGGPRIQAQTSNANPLIALAMQFGDASGKRGGLRSALGMVPNPKDLTSMTEPHERGSILVAAIFDAFFTVYLRRTADLFRIYRAGTGVVTGPDIPGPLANALADEASKTADEFFAICVRALDYCPPVDITFGDYLRAILTAHLDFEPVDRDGARDALMEAFRLRGIYPEAAFGFSEESLFWPKVRRGALPDVVGLQFGDPNGLTKEEKDNNGDVLRDYAKQNASALGFDRAKGSISAPSFHPMFHMGNDGRLYVDMVVELIQTTREPFEEAGTGTFPMRNGATLLISQDPPTGENERPPPRVRFVISKPYTPERASRIKNYHVSTGRAISEKRERGLVGGAEDDTRFQLDFALLHAGI
ncbi:conserved hypothetical protein [Mesorhizobium plurifarium]|uniref:Peptidase M4 n=1 Tax=Mesorhizobium plurifarium TaxID=69974 RepID=A0A090DZN3_MESPL|nr:conserved hypothetical protein [Mesorhizobium plurifarium]